MLLHRTHPESTVVIPWILMSSLLSSTLTTNRSLFFKEGWLVGSVSCMLSSRWHSDARSIRTHALRYPDTSSEGGQHFLGLQRTSIVAINKQAISVLGRFQGHNLQLASFLWHFWMASGIWILCLGKALTRWSKLWLIFWHTRRKGFIQNCYKKHASLPLLCFRYDSPCSHDSQRCNCVTYHIFSPG
jgi:hypothetical protein